MGRQALPESIPEVIFVHALNFVCLANSNAYTMLDHKLCQPLPIDKHDPVLHPMKIFVGFL